MKRKPGIIEILECRPTICEVPCPHDSDFDCRHCERAHLSYLDRREYFRKLDLEEG